MHANMWKCEGGNTTTVSHSESNFSYHFVELILKHPIQFSGSVT